MDTPSEHNGSPQSKRNKDRSPNEQTPKIKQHCSCKYRTRPVLYRTRPVFSDTSGMISDTSGIFSSKLTKREKSETPSNGVQKSWNFNHSSLDTKGRSPQNFSSKLQSEKYRTRPVWSRTRPVWTSSFSGKIKSSHNLIKSTPNDLKLCTRVHKRVERQPLKDHSPRQTLTPWIEGIKENPKK